MWNKIVGLQRNYWWPRIQADVKNYVEGCETCQRTKVRHVRPSAPLQPNAIPNNIYKVEKVLDSKLIHRKLHYLVHWKGYPIEKQTWEPIANLNTAKELVKDFHKEHPSAPCPIARGLVRFTAYENFTEPTFAPRMLFDWDNGVLWLSGQILGSLS